MIGLAKIRSELTANVRALAPDAVPLPDVVALWEGYDAIERQAAAPKTLLARRVEESRAWQRAGHRSAAEFMASRAGTSIGAARAQLALSQKLEQLPVIEQAFRDGALSEAKATAVVDGSSVNPDAAARLLEQAERGSLKELRDEVLRVRTAADPDPEITQQRIHARRQYRSWRDAEGAWHAALCGTALAGARFEARLKPLIDEEFASARAEGRHEPREAYAFDAVMALADQPGADDAKHSRSRFTTIVRVDLDALRRGTLADGDSCDIPGLGPISVSTARELLGESILKLVITKGVDVLNVTHLGRGPTTAQKIALLWSSPMCSVAGCSHAAREVDHREPYATNRETRLDNLDPLCRYHHALKTLDGWALVEGRGKREMVPPHDPRHPKNRPREDTS